MIDNEYAYTLPAIHFDLDKIKEIVAATVGIQIPGLASHQRPVENSSYLSNIKKQYPFLSDLYNIYNTSQNYITPVHTDALRNCALNVPIVNTENSHTVFYKFVGEEQTRFIRRRVYNLVESDIEEVFRFTLSEPTLINTKVPHGVLDHGSDTRIIMSWSISNNYTFAETKKLLSQWV